jgi:hypothetical protein
MSRTPCVTTTSTYTTTTCPPWTPPPGSNACLRSLYTCQLVAGVSTWVLQFRDTVPNASCDGTIICDPSTYYREYLSTSELVAPCDDPAFFAANTAACQAANPPPVGPDPNDSACIGCHPGCRTTTTTTTPPPWTTATRTPPTPPTPPTYPPTYTDPPPTGKCQFTYTAECNEGVWSLVSAVANRCVIGCVSDDDWVGEGCTRVFTYCGEAC